MKDIVVYAFDTDLFCTPMHATINTTERPERTLCGILIGPDWTFEDFDLELGIECHGCAELWEANKVETEFEKCPNCGSENYTCVDVHILAGFNTMLCYNCGEEHQVKWEVCDDGEKRCGEIGGGLGRCGPSYG